MHYSISDWDFRLFNLETLILLAYPYREFKCFALLI